jgi:hypothetical protein
MRFKSYYFFFALERYYYSPKPNPLAEKPQKMSSLFDKLSLIKYNIELSYHGWLYGELYFRGCIEYALI